MDPSHHSSLSVQAQIRRNATEQQNFLAGMAQWEKDIKAKDAELRRLKKSKRSVPGVGGRPSSVSGGQSSRGGAGRSSAASPPASSPLPGSVRESCGTVRTSMSDIRPASPSDFLASPSALEAVNSKRRSGDERGVFLGTGLTDQTPADVVVAGAVSSVSPGLVPRPPPPPPGRRDRGGGEEEGQRKLQGRGLRGRR